MDHRTIVSFFTCQLVWVNRYIYLITQEKNGISALELSRQLGISYNATWRMKHKIMQAMKSRDDELPISGFL